MSCTAEQRRALALLTDAGLDGASQASLMAHGFCVSMIGGLIKRGLATLTYEKIRAGSRLVDVGRVRITAAGQRVLAPERWRFTLRAHPAVVAELVPAPPSVRASKQNRGGRDKPSHDLGEIASGSI